jgi:CBS domain-containing protein
MTITVGRMIEGKTAIYSTSPEATVFEALGLMADKNVGALLVLDGGALVGIFSERDYARKIILLGRTSRETTVQEIMTREVVTVAPDTRAEQCMALMTERRIRHLPVLDRGVLVGIVSIGDVVRAVISEQQETITHLVGYIGSGA